MPLGISFQPSDQGGMTQQRPGGQTGGSPLQTAIQLLSLRLPSVVGARALAPQQLLQGAGGAGVAGGATSAAALQFLRRLLSGGLSGAGGLDMGGGMDMGGMSGGIPPPVIRPGGEGGGAPPEYKLPPAPPNPQPPSQPQELPDQATATGWRDWLSRERSLPGGTPPRY